VEREITQSSQGGLNGYVLLAWRKTPPDGCIVSGDERRAELQYQIQTGATKTANAKQIQAAIDKLILSI